MGILNYKKDNLKAKLGGADEEKRVENLVKLHEKRIAEAKVKSVKFKGRK